MVRFMLSVNIVIVLTVVVAADDNAKALALLKGVEKERLKYDCFHIRFEESWLGKDIIIEQTVDFDKGKIRKIYLPSAFFQGRERKSIFLEDVAYSMMDSGAKLVAVVPHQSAHVYSACIAPSPQPVGFTGILYLTHRLFRP